MVRLIAGGKGKGKTKYILDRANKIIPYTKPSPMKVTFVGDTYSGKSTVLWGLGACDGMPGISLAQVSNIYSLLWMYLSASECILLFYDATEMNSLRRALGWYDIALDTFALRISTTKRALVFVEHSGCVRCVSINLRRPRNPEFYTR